MQKRPFFFFDKCFEFEMSDSEEFESSESEEEESDNEEFAEESSDEAEFLDEQEVRDSQNEVEARKVGRGSKARFADLQDVTVASVLNLVALVVTNQSV